MLLSGSAQTAAAGVDKNMCHIGLLAVTVMNIE
jgi:hypothetical protein